jgi:hypothetical protein
MRALPSRDDGRRHRHARRRPATAQAGASQGRPGAGRRCSGTRRRARAGRAGRVRMRRTLAAPSSPSHAINSVPHLNKDRPEWLACANRPQLASSAPCRHSAGRPGPGPTLRASPGYTGADARGVRIEPRRRRDARAGHARIGSAGGLTRKAGSRPRLNHGTPEAGWRRTCSRALARSSLRHRA